MASLKSKFRTRRSRSQADRGWLGTRRLGRSVKVPAAITALLLVGVAVALLAGSSSKSNGAQSEAIQGSATATVQRRELVETDTQTGTLGYRDSRNLYNHLTGTVTWAPKPGAVIHPDGVLYRVDGAGVFLFDGVQPVYRAFKSGMTEGSDVRQLNRALRALGYDEGHEITLDASFGEATEAAIKRWQEAHGLKQTGEIELGRIAFQPGARRVQSVSLTTGASASSAGGAETGAGSTGSASGAAYQEATESTSGNARSAAYTRGAPAEAVAYAAAETPATSKSPTTPGATPPTATTPTTTTAPSAPTATAPSKTSPTGSKSSGGKPSAAATPTARSTAAPSITSTPAASSGASASASSTTAASVSNVALVTTSLNPVVTVALETSKQTEARAGDTVQVTLPSTSVVTGHITSVGSVAEKASSSASSSGSTSSTSTVNVYISLAGHGAGSLDQAPVSVAFAAQREKNALSVPVTALVATAGGNFAVDVVEGKTRHLVGVTPGLYAGGYVAVSGSIAEGTTVSAGNQ